MASATLSDATISLINNECKKATAPEISRKIARCRGHMTTIRNKMEGNVRILRTHPANDAAAAEMKRHLDDLNAQYWRASYLMEIYISVIEEEARQAEEEPDLRQVGEREEGMRKEYERACLAAQECLAEHQNMSIGNNQQPRAQPGRLYKANGEFKPDTLTKDSSAGQYEFWKRQFKRYYATSNMDLAPIGDQRGHLEKCCLLYTSPSPRDKRQSRMPSSA